MSKNMRTQTRVYSTDPHITFYVELDPNESEDPWVHCLRAVIDGEDQPDHDALHQWALDRNRKASIENELASPECTTEYMTWALPKLAEINARLGV